MSNYSWIFSLVGNILVLMGWLVVYNNAKRIASRAETKSLIDNVSKLVNEISEGSIAYWLTAGRADGGVAASKESTLYLLKIMSKISQSAEYTEIIKKRGISISDRTFSEIISTTTLNCEKAHLYDAFGRQIKAQECLDSCAFALRHIYSEFEKAHPPSSHLSLFDKLRQFSTKVDKWYENHHQ